MDQLVIQITGQIQSSNFAEWKARLLAQIGAANVSLHTDADFLQATEQVKRFKEAERSLKEAKQAAIDQAPDIHRLFGSIDEISGQCRQVRLSLDRQIKARKEEIKAQCIELGLADLRAFLAKQGPDLGVIDHRAYLDRALLEEVTKGKATLQTLHAAVRARCDEVKAQLVERAQVVKRNRAALDAVPRQHKVLFQDEPTLLALSERELQLVVEKRVALFQEEAARQREEVAQRQLQRLEDADLNAPAQSVSSPLSGQRPIAEVSGYQVTLDLCACREEAIEIAREIKQRYAQNPLVTKVRLSHRQDESPG
jgi:hypothetical protein